MRDFPTLSFQRGTDFGRFRLALLYRNLRESCNITTYPWLCYVSYLQFISSTLHSLRACYYFCDSRNIIEIWRCLLFFQFTKLPTKWQIVRCNPPFQILTII